MSDITLPRGWSLPRLGELMAFKNGLNKGKDYFGHGTPIVNYMDVFNHSGMGRSDIVGLVDVTKAEKKAYSARRGDVFFTRTSETPEEVGISSVLTEDINDAVFSGFVLRGRPQADRISSSFAEYCFASRFVREQIVASATYTTRALTNGRTLSAVRLPLPEDPVEQQTIAEALSDADGVVEGLKRLIAKKRRIKQGAMQDLLTAKRRLPGFSGEWDNFRLSEHGKFLSGSGFPLIYQGHSSGDYPFFKVSDFSGKNNKAQLTSANHYIDTAIQKKIGARIFPADAIVFAKIGAAIFLERKRMTAQNSCLDNNMGAYVLQDPNLCAHLILAKFQTFALGDLVSSTALPAITSSDLKAIEFFLPKDLDEQKAVAGILREMDAEISALETRLQKARQIKEGLMQNLLTGRVRLV